MHCWQAIRTEMQGLLVLQRLPMALSPSQMIAFKRWASGTLKRLEHLSARLLTPLGLWLYTLFFFPEGELSRKPLSHQGVRRSCSWSPVSAICLVAVWAAGRKGQEKATLRSWKSKTVLEHHTLNKPELFCHPQNEWEYLFLFQWY